MYLHNMSNRTVLSAGGTSFVLDAWHLYVVLNASRFTCCTSRRLTITWRPIGMPPVVWTGWVPLNHATDGSGRPEKELKVAVIFLNKKGTHLCKKNNPFKAFRFNIYVYNVDSTLYCITFYNFVCRLNAVRTN